MLGEVARGMKGCSQVFQKRSRSVLDLTANVGEWQAQNQVTLPSVGGLGRRFPEFRLHVKVQLWIPVQAVG
ncbi:hypothetical protein I79_010538 [Cricetulus griseus]|uniref:Uncharacterized protein n=1 Tax=Cricetulus griseus TaxID=10029 RepID=G3HIR2_CRIGR|nr:hypothetical protein I79_010538 [Cricetulus griseus]